MPLFELDGGILVPAQFGRTVEAEAAPEILASVRDQVLEIIGRPLFPITWTEEIPEQPRLTALDPSGQVVAVEVLPLLDSSTIIEALSRLAETANMGWNDLALAYPGGANAFRFGWAEYRNHMPPSPAPGPRLILVTTQIKPDVRPVLDVLTASGVEVHELAIREMSNGRRFVEVQAVGPRLYGHNPNLLLQGNGQLNNEQLGLPGNDAQRTDVPRNTAPQPVEKPAANRAVFTTPQPLLVEKPEKVQTQVAKKSEGDAHSLQENATGLYAIGQIVGVETELVWQFTPVERYYAKLSPEGVISGENWHTDDPDEAVRLIGSVVPFNGWDVWRLGSADGPSLREALQEINRELASVAKEPKYSGRRVRRR